MSKTLRVPSYRRHKPTGQAVVTLSGKDHYLGTWKTAASKAEYNRLIGEWVAAGRCLPASRRGYDLTVAELGAAYWNCATGYYRRMASLLGHWIGSSWPSACCGPPTVPPWPTTSALWPPSDPEAIGRQPPLPEVLQLPDRQHQADIQMGCLARVATRDDLPRAWPPSPGLPGGRVPERPSPSNRSPERRSRRHVALPVADRGRYGSASSANRLPAGRSLHPSPMRSGYLGHRLDLSPRITQDRKSRSRTASFHRAQGSRRSATVPVA